MALAVIPPNVVFRMLYVVFLLGDSPGSEFFVQTFRNTSQFIGKHNL